MRVDDPLPAGIDAVVNTARIFADGVVPDIDPSNNTATDRTPIVPPPPPPPTDGPDLALVKDDGGVGIAPGETLTYELTYQNLGDVPAFDVRIEDVIPRYTSLAPGGSPASCTGSLPGDRCTFELGTLAPGDAGRVTIRLRVDDPVPAGVTRIVNTAVIAGESIQPDANPSNNGAADTTPVQLPPPPPPPPGGAPDLVLTKDDAGASVMPGGEVFYSLSFENRGTAAATNVRILDTIPPYTTYGGGSAAVCSGNHPGGVCTFELGTLEPGDSGQVIFNLLIDDPFPVDVAAVANTAVIEGDSVVPDSDPGNNRSTAITPVTQTAPEVDLLVELIADRDTLHPDDLLGYTVRFANRGPAVATGVLLAMPVPELTRLYTLGTEPVWICEGQEPGALCTAEVGDLPAGATGFFQLGVRVNALVPPDLPGISATVEILNGPTSPPDRDITNNRHELLVPFERDGAPVDVPTLSTVGITVMVLGLALAMVVVRRRKHAELS